MSKNILLDRFRSEVVPFFFKHFESKGKKVSIISYNGKEPKGNFCDKKFLFDDYLILNGSYFKDVPWIINSSDLKFFHQHEGLVINLFSRFTITPSYWSATEMSTHGLNIFNFWKYNLLKKKIDTCFSYYTPHDPSSFILYMVSKYLKIPHIYIDSPMILSGIRYMSCSFEKRNLLIQNKFSKTPDWVNNTYLEYLKEFNKNFILPKPIFLSKKNFYYKTSSEKFQYYKKKIFNIIRKKKFLAINIILSKILKKLIPEVPIFFKFKRGSWNYISNNINRIQYLIVKIKINLRLKKLKNIYTKFSSNPENLKKINYILFAANLIPEGSIMPSAMWNRHTEVCLKAIIANLPPNWKVIYKANPGQFETAAPHSTFIDWHNEDYYKSLVKTKKILFAPLKMSTEELIKNSKGVATINGTIALEALFYKKNSIIFTSIWFEKLKGVFLCKNKSDIEFAINKMKNQTQYNLKLPQNLFLEQTTFKVTKWAQNSFVKKDLKTVADKFLSSEKIFKKLGPEKWNF